MYVYNSFKYLNVVFYLTVYIFSLIKAVISYHFGVRDPIVFNSEKISPICRDLPRQVSDDNERTGRWNSNCLQGSLLIRLTCSHLIFQL